MSELVRRNIRVDSGIARNIEFNSKQIICSTSELYELGAYFIQCLGANLANDWLEEYNQHGRVRAFERIIVDARFRGEL